MEVLEERRIKSEGNLEALKVQSSSGQQEMQGRVASLEKQVQIEREKRESRPDPHSVQYSPSCTNAPLANQGSGAPPSSSASRPSEISGRLRYSTGGSVSSYLHLVEDGSGTPNLNGPAFLVPDASTLEICTVLTGYGPFSEVKRHPDLFEALFKSNRRKDKTLLFQELERLKEFCLEYEIIPTPCLETNDLDYPPLWYWWHVCSYMDLSQRNLPLAFDIPELLEEMFDRFA